MNLQERNRAIKEHGKATRKRRGGMLCRVFEVKVVSSRMNHAQKEFVNALFREAKWFRNAYIADRSSVTDKSSSVPVKVGDVFETRSLEVMGSHIKQSIIAEVKENIRDLALSKAAGNKVGALKFKSFCNCVNLKQYNNTYKIDFSKSTVRVQGCKKPFKVRGLQQIPGDAEIANAKFLRKASGLYFHITCYLPVTEKIKPCASVGIDFGIKDNLVFSDGREPINIAVPESKGTKLASRQMNKALAHNGNKKTKNHWKRVQKLRKAYEHDKNKRNDAANKAVHDILSNYEIVAIQDEMIHNWHAGLFGGEVQHSAIGAVKAKLKKSSSVRVVDRSFPSTQICPVCGKLTKHPLKEREYHCKHCGYHHPSRDVKAAQSILDEAMRFYKVSPEQRAQSPVEVESYIDILVFPHYRHDFCLRYRKLVTSSHE